MLSPRLDGGVSVPSKPKIPCSHPGCPELVPPGTKYCDTHRRLHPQPSRGATERGYTYAWSKASKAFLRSHPLCEECLKGGKYVKATVIDHIVPHRGDRTLFWDRSNWQALCKQCHDRKTGREDRRVQYRF